MSDRTPKPTEGVEELAATSNDILDTLERLRELEKERRSEQPTSVRFRELAGEIERLSNDIFRSAVKETTLAETIEPTHRTIDEVDENA